ncbi:hypothetical protein EVAR_73906_1 [Eumeta japonica]|uniref:MH2 domain-containing protein n=1 Tax=Eumeta variegata TaxID=151549 RepID=A0A4C1SR72_EUMVA|nr:hypothetical protein EVAR_73906_1 [Eumeta japonica]
MTIEGAVHSRLPSTIRHPPSEKPSWESEWCRLAYWEQARRVGRQVGVRLRAVDVFGAGGDSAHGLCLGALAASPPPTPPADTVADEVSVELLIDIHP